LLITDHCFISIYFFAAKALELFLGLIIEQAHAVTAERGSKKVEVYHLCVFKTVCVAFYIY